MPDKDFYQVSLKLILKNDKNEMLILKARDNGAFAGFYDLPGGRIDDNEFDVDLLKIMKREVTEEIGNVEVSIIPKPVATGRARLIKLDYKGDPLRVLYIFYEAHYQGGEIVISEEHTGYKWIKLTEVKLENYFNLGILEGLKMYLQYEKA